MGKYELLIDDCFWDYNFTDKDIDRIATSDDLKQKRFLFEKILANSTWLLKDLKIFPKDQLEQLLSDYVAPNFNYDYLARRKDIVEFHFFGKELSIEELKWEK
ncbi:MAG: hypothetical protein KAG92_01050 [Deltaproteobacteria bacterium]|nr:hypothetical protein [Deltaproteobacteria bacterium]